VEQWNPNPKEREAWLKRRERKQEQLRRRKRRQFEERIEPLIAPHATRVREGEWVPLGRERDLYPSPKEDREGPDGENRLWLDALLAVTARHGIAVALGWIYPAADIPSQLPRPQQILLVPKGTHDPPEPEVDTPLEEADPADN
jgi:hypothetical protein